MGKHTAFAAITALVLILSPAAMADGITVVNPSFESPNSLVEVPGGGVWPDASGWTETGPVGGDLNAFPPGLVPPGFEQPDGATLDTGVFFNSAFTQDGDGNIVPNPSYITNADGSQVAFMFASPQPVPGEPAISFRQQLSTAYTAGTSYELTVAVGKSFFLAPINVDNLLTPAMDIQLVWFDTDAAGDLNVLATKRIFVDDVESTLLTDFTATLDPLAADHEAVGKLIGIHLTPAIGTSGVWTFDSVRLVPEPTSAAALLAGASLLLLRRRRQGIPT